MNQSNQNIMKLAKEDILFDEILDNVKQVVLTPNTHGYSTTVEVNGLPMGVIKIPNDYHMPNSRARWVITKNKIPFGSKVEIDGVLYKAFTSPNHDIAQAFMLIPFYNLVFPELPTCDLPISDDNHYVSIDRNNVVATFLAYGDKDYIIVKEPVSIAFDYPVRIPKVFMVEDEKYSAVELNRPSESTADYNTQVYWLVVKDLEFKPSSILEFEGMQFIQGFHVGGYEIDLPPGYSFIKCIRVVNPNAITEQDALLGNVAKLLLDFKNVKDPSVKRDILRQAMRQMDDLEMMVMDDMREERSTRRDSYRSQGYLQDHRFNRKSQLQDFLATRDRSRGMHYDRGNSWDGNQPKMTCGQFFQELENLAQKSFNQPLYRHINPTPDLDEQTNPNKDK